MFRLRCWRAGWCFALGLALLANGANSLWAGEKEELFAAFDKATKLAAKADYAAAAAQYERALALAPRVFGPDAENTAAILNNLAALYDDMGQYAKAEPLYQRSLNIREAKLGPDHPDVAAGLNNLAILYKAMGQYAKAEPLYQRGLKIREAKLGPDHPLVADSFNNLAILYMAMGQYAKAEPLYQRGLKIKEAKLGPDHPLVADSLNNLAILYKDMGQYAKAEPLYQRGLKIYEAKLGPDHPLVADSLNNLASLYVDTGQYAKAEPLYQRSLKIYEAKLGPDHPLVAASLNNLASLYVDMGQYAKAEPLYQRSLKIYEAKLGPDHPDVAASLNNLAILYDDMGQYAKAEPLYQRGLKIREAKLGPDHPDVAAGLNNLANLYVHMSQYAKAEPLYQRGLKIKEAKLGPDHALVAASLNNLAILYKAMGQYPKAEPLYQRSLNIREAKLGPDHPLVADSLNNLAWLHQSLGQFDDAAREFDLMRRIVRRHVAEVLPVLTEREQLTFIQHNDETYFHCALSFGRLHREQQALAAESAGWLVNGKAVVQESLAERMLLARDSHDPAVAAKSKQLTALRTELAGLSQTMPKPGQEAAHRRKLAELSGQEQELARQVNQAVGRPVHENPWIDPAAVRGALAADAVLVDIARFRPYIFESKGNEEHWRPARYVAWITPPAGKGNIEIVDLGAAEEIDEAIEAVRQAIEQSAMHIKQPANDEEPAERAALVPITKLAALVLDPLKVHLTDAKELVLSPDSNLWLVPWAALPVEEGEYAIERWRIRYVTSGRDLVTEQLVSQSARRKHSGPLIFADPDYNLDSKGLLAATRAVLRGKETQLDLRGAVGRSESWRLRVNRLPATATEALLITPALRSYAHESPTLYSEQFALEGVLKFVESPQVLVLSTHGYYQPDQEVKRDDKAAGLAAGDDLAGGKRGALLASDGQPLENPLLRCGLLLAGCNNPPTGDVDDGVVTGMEIVGCDLRGAELVVLSACQTGLGDVRNGEGVAGLRQAFQLAGARAVVSTLWRIPDTESAKLMGDFFNNLAAGQPKVAALANAQLAAIKARRQTREAAHPYFWAAFTITGN